MTEMLHTLTCIFGALALLALVSAGLVMMFAPATGRQMLKNAFIALACLLSPACSCKRPAMRSAMPNEITI